MASSPAARRIKSAYLDLLAERPNERVNVTELARRAKVNRVTFYRLYGAQEDVLLDILDDFDRANRVYMDQVQTDNPDLVGLVVTMLKLHRDNMPMLRTVLRSSMAPYLVERIESGTRSGIGEGLLDGDERGKMLTSFYISGVTRVMCDWILGGCREDIGVLIAFFEQAARIIAD